MYFFAAGAGCWLLQNFSVDGKSGNEYTVYMVYFSYFWKTSTDQMDQENQSYYEKQTEVFMSHFNEAIVELRKQSITLSVGSRSKDSGFYQGSESFSENAYGLYEAMLELRELYSSWGRNKTVECGIYYYEIDRVVTWEGSRSADHFIRYMTNAGEAGSLTEFFRQENYEPSKMLFGTTNTGEKADGSMLVGYCTTMGGNLNPVLIFYILSEEMFLDFLNMAYRGGGNDYCIMDQETGQVYLALYLSDSPERTADFWREEEYLYRGGESPLPLDFVVRIAEDSLQNNILIFRKTMYRLLLFTILALMVVCVGILYINYMPIYKLVKDIGYREEDEFTAVRIALDSRSSKMKEQEMLILDLLTEHLIRGIPIPRERVRHFGFVSNMKYYQVYVLEGGVLLSADTERLTEEIERGLPVRIFVTDWQEDGKNILIVFMEGPDQERVGAFLHRYFAALLEQGYALRAGKMVDSMDEIRSSFLACTRKSNVQKQERKEEGRAKMKEEVLAYLETHYRDPDLSQGQVADEFRISVYTLSRMFKKQVGVGFVEYVNYKRMEYAKELLLTTDYPVKTIAVMCGFANDNYFSKYFKNVVGESPSSFREI